MRSLICNLCYVTYHFAISCAVLALYHTGIAIARRNSCQKLCYSLRFSLKTEDRHGVGSGAFFFRYLHLLQLCANEERCMEENTGKCDFRQIGMYQGQDLICCMVQTKQRKPSNLIDHRLNHGSLPLLAIRAPGGVPSV